MSELRNKSLPKRVDQIPELKDFYNQYDELEVTPESRKAYQRMLEKLSDEERELLQHADNYYTVTIKNIGGLVMPVILKVLFEDGSERMIRLPAEIWVKNNQIARTSFASASPLRSIELDPHRETADANRDNNYFPPRLEPSRFQIYKANESRREAGNPMREARKREEEARKREEEAGKREEEAGKQEEGAQQSDEKTSQREEGKQKVDGRAAQRSAKRPAAAPAADDGN
ncbi:MAG: hypothetical protein D6753_16755 [Planctomycetota bacterium]|nr:MAG: hypothetical protein D6753_16755 [Planctomycetota bacterium]